MSKTRHFTSLCYSAMLGMLVLSSTDARADPSDPVLLLDYSGMSGSFVPGPNRTGHYTATSVDQFAGLGWTTTGSATRVVTPPGQSLTVFSTPATYGNAGILIDLTVSNIDANTADAAGTITVCDVDGDLITGTIGGLWIQTLTGVSFHGTVTEVVLNSSNGNEWFDGTEGLGGFSLDFIQFTSIINIEMESTGACFDSAFSNEVSGVNAQLVPNPEPSLLGLIGLALIGCVRRRI